MVEASRDGTQEVRLATSLALSMSPVVKLALVAACQLVETCWSTPVELNALDVIVGEVLFPAGAETVGVFVLIVVNEIVGSRAKECGEVRIGHPSGILEVFVKMKKLPDNKWDLQKAGVCRTAKPIMEGLVYVPGTLYGGR